MIYIMRLIAGIILLSIASYQDIKTRHVSDFVWGLMLLVGILLIYYDLLFSDIVGIKELLLMCVLIILAYVIFVVFNKQQYGSFGGADAKAFASIAILLPVPIILDVFPFSYITILFGELTAFSFYFPKALKVPRKEWKNITMPLIPFLLIGFMFAIIMEVICGI